MPQAVSTGERLIELEREAAQATPVAGRTSPGLMGL
jgi:hypothetical protein